MPLVLQYLIDRARTGVTPFEMKTCGDCHLFVENSKLADRLCSTCEGSMQPSTIRCNRCHTYCRHCNEPTCSSCMVGCTEKCVGGIATHYLPPCCPACSRHKSNSKCFSCGGGVCGCCGIAQHQHTTNRTLCADCAVLEILRHGGGRAAGIVGTYPSANRRGTHCA